MVVFSSNKPPAAEKVRFNRAAIADSYGREDDSVRLNSFSVCDCIVFVVIIHCLRDMTEARYNRDKDNTGPEYLEKAIVCDEDARYASY